MIYPKKVRTVVQIQMFEQKEGREILRLKDNYEEQPVWNGMMLHALTGFLLFIILAILAILAAPDWFAEMYEKVGNVWAAVIVALIMAVFSVIYSLIADIIFRTRYLRLRSALCGYRAKCRLLERINQEQEV